MHQNWIKRHPQKAIELMKFFKMETEEDEIKCPRCNLVIKPKGIVLDGSIKSKYYIHLGSFKCRMREEMGSDLKDSYLTYIRLLKEKEEMEKGERPSCACGCGEKVSWNINKRRWRKYVFGHPRKYLSYLDKITDGETQADFYKRMNIDNRLGSHVLSKLEKLGLIKREKVLNKSRWTFRIHLIRS
jgi:hypothetical protein